MSIEHDSSRRSDIDCRHVSRFMSTVLVGVRLIVFVYLFTSSFVCSRGGLFSCLLAPHLIIPGVIVSVDLFLLFTSSLWYRDRLSFERLLAGEVVN